MGDAGGGAIDVRASQISSGCKWAIQVPVVVPHPSAQDCCPFILEGQNSSKDNIARGKDCRGSVRDDAASDGVRE